MSLRARGVSGRPRPRHRQGRPHRGRAADAPGRGGGAAGPEVRPGDPGLTERFSELVAIGRVVKPQGRKGEVLTEPLSDRPDRFPCAGPIVAGPGGARRARSGQRPAGRTRAASCLKLEGVDSIDDAEALPRPRAAHPRGRAPGAARGLLLPPPARRVCACEDEDGCALGVVEDIWETGGEAPVLVVRGDAGEVLIPLAETFVQARGPRRRACSWRVPRSWWMLRIDVLTIFPRLVRRLPRGGNRPPRGGGGARARSASTTCATSPRTATAPWTTPPSAAVPGWS